jgi:hypothetical protein
MIDVPAARAILHEDGNGISADAIIAAAGEKLRIFHKTLPRAAVAGAHAETAPVVLSRLSWTR